MLPRRPVKVKQLPRSHPQQPCCASAALSLYVYVRSSGSINKRPWMRNGELSALTIQGEGGGEEAKLCAAEKFLWPVKHVLWRELMWRVTRHPRSLRLADDQPLTYGPRAPLEPRPDTVRCDNGSGSKPALKPCPLPCAHHSSHSAAARPTPPPPPPIATHWRRAMP